MGWFGGYNEEEFLDPDEIRLRRESAARSRKAHKECIADHRDDHPGSILPVNNTRPHNDCKADHGADRINTNAVVGISIFIAILFVILGLMIPLIFIN